MNSLSTSAPEIDVPTTQPARSQTEHRVLFVNWTEPDIASGTPVILCDLLAHFPPGDAEMLCEENFNAVKKRQVEIKHPVHKIRFQNILWPFRRGSRVRQWLVNWGVPWIVLVGLWRVMRFRPTCIVSIYFRQHWILAAYLIAKLSRVPLIFYVHDAMPQSESDGRFGRAYKRWLERTTLRGSRIVSLNPHMAQYYHERYGAPATVLRHIAQQKPLPARPVTNHSGTLVIGFSGAIYDSNARQLGDVAQIANALPGVRFKLWTDASPGLVAEAGVTGDHVEVGFESSYQRLLERLTECHLLYLPLAFGDERTLTSQALQFTFPTKTLDYLVAGVPILAHCPADYEMSRFFKQYHCGYVLNEAGPTALRTWITDWAESRVESLDDQNRLAALEMFSAEENRRILWEVMDQETGRPAKPAS